MSEIIDQFYTPLLIEHGFIHDPLGMTLFPGRNYLHTVGCLPVVSKHLLEATLHTRL